MTPGSRLDLPNGPSYRPGCAETERAGLSDSGFGKCSARFKVAINRHGLWLFSPSPRNHV